MIYSVAFVWLNIWLMNGFRLRHSLQRVLRSETHIINGPNVCIINGELIVIQMKRMPEVLRIDDKCLPVLYSLVFALHLAIFWSIVG